MKNTKERLLEATFRLISKKGYLGTTTREIAHKAGVTELTLFRHFGSKEKLFEEVLNRYSFLPELKELLPSLRELPYIKSLQILGERFIETLKDKKFLIKIMFSEINLYPDKVKDIYSKFIDEIIKTLAEYFDYLQKKDLIRRFPSVEGARAFLGMFFSYFLSEEILMGRSVDEKEFKKVTREFIYLFMKGTLKDKSCESNIEN
ncbi:MAG: TetR/AcrR family transcriptional regulator [Thermodesulfovibrionales bacterium]